MTSDRRQQLEQAMRLQLEQDIVRAKEQLLLAEHAVETDRLRIEDVLRSLHAGKQQVELYRAALAQLERERQQHGAMVKAYFDSISEQHQAMTAGRGK